MDIEWTSVLTRLPVVLGDLVRIVFARVYYMIPEKWTPEATFAFLLSLGAIYLSMLSIYRTASLAIRTVGFIVKWGMLIGAVSLAIGWLSGNVQTVDLLPTRRGARPLGSRPKPWESFAKHDEYNRRYKARYRHRAQETDEDARQLVRQVVDYVWSNAQALATERALFNVVNVANGLLGRGSQAGEAQRGTDTNGKKNTHSR